MRRRARRALATATSAMPSSFSSLLSDSVMLAYAPLVFLSALPHFFVVSLHFRDFFYCLRLMVTRLGDTLTQGAKCREFPGVDLLREAPAAEGLHAHFVAMPPISYRCPLA